MHVLKVLGVWPKIPGQNLPTLSHLLDFNDMHTVLSVCFGQGTLHTYIAILCLLCFVDKVTALYCWDNDVYNLHVHS